MLKQSKKIIAILFILTAGLFAANFALAQADNLLFGGLQNETGSTIGLGAGDDPRIMAAKIIRVFIGFLGIIAVGLIMYAGFLWMTSEGDSEKIERAKSILKNAVIGLIIIISSFAIVSFILNRLLGGTGGGSGAGGGPPAPGAGLGALGSCSVESVYPEPEQKDIPRNMAMIIVTFKEKVAQNTLCKDANNNEICDAGELILPQNVRIFSGDDVCDEDSNPDCTGNVTDVEVQTNDNKTIVFLLNSWLGSPSEEMWYSVNLTNGIEKENPNNPLDRGIFSSCNPEYLEWRFKVSTKVDLTPPQVQSIFPSLDNYADGDDALELAKVAAGSITVNGQPKSYAAAKVNSATKNPSDAGWDSATASVSAGCAEDGDLSVSVSDAGASATLYRGATLLGAGNVSGNTVNFSYCGLNLTSDFSLCSGAIGSCLWTVNISPEVKADTLTVGGTTYIFGDNIEVGVDQNATAANIAAAINSHPSVKNDPAYIGGNIVNLKARAAGEAGNNIALQTSAAGLSLITMSGGADQSITAKILGKKDEPRNAVVQVNFNETINPLTVSGEAKDVQNYIAVKCLSGADCNPANDGYFACGTDTCVDGKFEISNQYRTVEFISTNLCGVNGCGENIYCLPPDSKLSVEIKAATLDPCTTNQKCIDDRKNPYISCSSNGVCQNAAGENYPLSSKIAGFDGVMDTALNSLNGNRDEDADGPEAQSLNPAYNENDLIANCDDTDENYEGRICTADNEANVCGAVDRCKYPNGDSVISGGARLDYLKSNQGDDYKWSFFVSDKIELAPPVINSVIPGVGDFGVDFVEPVKISFDKIMMSSSLKTGTVEIYNGKDWKTHKLINLWSLSGAPLGYWITKENLPADGNPAYTEAQIKHSMFSDATSYRSQAGSGIKDIYQNCFKPSSGPGCTATEVSPSCCDGSATAGESCD